MQAVVGSLDDVDGYDVEPLDGEKQALEVRRQLLLPFDAVGQRARPRREVDTHEPPLVRHARGQAGEQLTSTRPDVDHGEVGAAGHVVCDPSREQRDGVRPQR